MKKLYNNHNYTLCHPERMQRILSQKTQCLSRFFIGFRMTVFSCLSSAGMTAVVLACLLLTPTFGLAAWTEENCTNKGGQIVTVGSQTFCKSTRSMNWWSAYSWCQAMGGYMPTITELCPNLQSLTQNASCPGYNDHIWSATPGTSTQPWIHHNNYKVVTKEPGYSTSTWPRAYCLQKTTASN